MGLWPRKGFLKKSWKQTIYDASKKALEEHRAYIEDRLKQLGPEVSLLRPEEMDKENRAQRDAIQAIFKEMK